MLGVYFDKPLAIYFYSYKFGGGIKGMSDIVLTILGCGAFSAFVTGVFNVVLNRMNRHDKKNDEKELANKEKEKEYHEKIDAIAEGVMYLELDKIKNLGMKYISEGSVDYDDRRILNKMHHNYHTKLKGNGDADNVMDGVNKLPLKQQNHE